MTLTIQVRNQDTLNLLRNMQNLGLINIQTVEHRSDVSLDTEIKPEKHIHSYHKLRGIHKNLPGASVDEFLKRCYAEKERELALENHG